MSESGQSLQLNDSKYMFYLILYVLGLYDYDVFMYSQSFGEVKSNIYYLFKTLSFKKMRKAKATRKHSLHGNTAA